MLSADTTNEAVTTTTTPSDINLLLEGMRKLHQRFDDIENKIEPIYDVYKRIHEETTYKERLFMNNNHIVATSNSFSSPDHRQLTYSEDGDDLESPVSSSRTSSRRGWWCCCT